MVKAEMSLKKMCLPAVVSVLYFLWFGFVAELRPEHFIMFAVLTAMYIPGGRLRRGVFALIPFAVYLMVYDSLKSFPNFMYNSMHIEDLYLLEKQLFGVHFNNQLLTLNEFFSFHQNRFFDVVSGVSYLTWLPMPVGFAVYLYFSGKKEIYTNFVFLFVLTNLTGFFIYYLYPAAPPWYVCLHGFEFIPDAPCVAARLKNFDNCIGVSVFEYIYRRNANVFAAIPSIHAANPLTCFIASLQLKNRLLSTAFLVVTCGMWFGAVYSNHHYLIDVLCGGLTALTALFIVRILLRKTQLNKYMLKYERAI